MLLLTQLNTVCCYARCVYAVRFSESTPTVVSTLVSRGQAQIDVAECKSSHEQYSYALWAYHCLLLAVAIAIASKTWYLADSTQESKPLAVSAYAYL
jgi:Tfp pilus assembly protein PilV